MTGDDGWSAAAADGGSDDRSGRPPGRRDPVVTAELAGRAGLAVVAAALAASVASAAPTGTPAIDSVERAILAAVVVLAAGAARPWTVLWLAGWLLAGSAGGGPIVLAGAATILAAVVVWRSDLPPVAACGVAALSTVTLYALPGGGPDGATAAVAAVAVAPVLVSGWRNCSDRAWRAARRVAIVTGVAAGVAVVLFLVGVALAGRAAWRGVDEVSAWQRTTEQGDLRGAYAHAREAADAFDEAAANARRPWLWPARALPGVGRYADVGATVAASGAELTRALVALDGFTRYDDLPIVNGRIDLGLVASLDAPITATHRAARQADETLAGIDRTWLVPPVQTGLDQLTDAVRELEDRLDLAGDAVQHAPGLLGRGTPRRYLLLFVTPSESRELGGAVAAYAELVVTDGALSVARSGPVSQLGVGPSPWATVTGTPDLPTVAATVATLYPASGGSPVDGVAVLDPAALAGLLRVTGPVTLPSVGETVTADNVVALLQRDQYTDPNAPTARRDLYELVPPAVVEKALTADALDLRTLARTLGPLVEQQHVRFWSVHVEEQPLLHRLGLDARFPPPGTTPDVLAVTSRNVTGNVADPFLTRTVRYEATVDPATGAVTGTVTVTLRSAVPTGLALEALSDRVVGNVEGRPRGTIKTVVALYTPLEVDKLTYANFPIAVDRADELGYHRFSQAVEVPPGGEVDLVFSVRGTVDRSRPYALTVWSPPLANPDQVEVRVGGGPRPVEGTVRLPGVATFRLPS